MNFLVHAQIVLPIICGFERLHTSKETIFKKPISRTVKKSIAVSYQKRCRDYNLNLDTENNCFAKMANSNYTGFSG